MRVRTGYSFRTAAGQLSDVVKRLQAISYPAAPISDRASTFGFVKWKKLAEKNGLRPIFGLELAVTESPNAKRPIVDYWTFFALDEIENVNKLLELATNQFRYEPLLTYDQANAADGVMKIIGHRSNLDLVVKDDNTFVALSPSVAKGYVASAEERGFRFIASSDNHYPALEDEQMYEIICNAGGGQTYGQHILSESEWRSALEDRASAETIENAHRVAQEWLRSDRWATLHPAQLLSPERPASLEDMCRVGAEKIGCDLSRPEYAARLQRELDLIKTKDFEDYFYIIADMVQWARSRMIVGPARGSSCGSLVCYLLEITTIDPIPFGLIFERFIDINRNDLPDIDIDFSDQKRQLVFDYMASKYGADRVARLGTVNMYQPRSAISGAGEALGIPKWKFDAALDSLIEHSSGDSRANLALEDTMNQTLAGQELIKDFPQIKIAARMEGHPRHQGQHAAGYVLTDQPVRKFVAVDSRTGATHCDKKDAEDLNLLKIDVLGLTQLSVFEDALELAGLDRLALEKVPLDDPKAFEVLNKGHFSGIFQFNGQALQSIASQITIDHVEDIISITALARPGPLATGGTQSWINRREGRENITHLTPMMEELTKDSYGIVIYQETVMNIVRTLGKMSWEDTSAIRKAMSKSLGDEFFEQYWIKFRAGAIENKIDEAVAREIWDQVNTFGSWAFNRSHSVAYGIISYWCCWLKAHYPLEFSAATLTHEKDPVKQLQILRELHAEGIEYLPVDAELSTNKWAVGLKDGKKRLVGPVQNVKGIGPTLTNQIVSARARGEPLPAKAAKLLADPKTPLDSLWPIRDAFNRLMPDPREKNIFSSPTPIAELTVKGFDYDAMVFVVLRKIDTRDENEPTKIAKRGYPITRGPTTSVNLRIADDTGTVFAKVNRFDFEAIGRPIIDRGGAGKVLYALKGRVPKDFQMLQIKMIRYIGEIDEELVPLEEAKRANND